MRIISFLLILSTTTFAFGFTVILKSGKSIEGRLIGEDQFSIQIKDSSGFLLSFKKTLLDLEAMSTANDLKQSVPAAVAQEKPNQSFQTVDLVKVARESKKNRTGAGRVYSHESLKDSPQVSVLGSDEGGTNREAKANYLQKGSEEAGALPSQEERYWRKTSMSLKKEVAALREKKIMAEEDCSSARQDLADRRSNPSRKPVDLLSLMKEPVECKRLKEVESQLKAAELQLDDFLERARKSEVPWRWLD